MTDYTKYNTGLDPEWVEFEKTNTVPTLPKDLALAKRIFNEERAELFRKTLGPVNGVSTEDICIPTQDGQSLPGRLYFPGTRDSVTTLLPVYVYMHGGGYLFGSIETEDMHCRIICHGVSCMVLNVGYRHTPEWTFPTPFQDVFDAVDWITDSSTATKYGCDLKNVVLGGVSSGATMSLAAAQREIEMGTKRISGLNLSLPSAVTSSRFPRHLVKNGYTSYEQNEHAPLLPVARLQSLHALLKADPNSPYLSTLLLPNSVLQEFPRTAFHICGADPVRDGGLLLEEKLRNLGVQTHLEVYGGWPHAFWNQPQLKKAAEYRKRLVDDAAWLFGI